MRRHEQPACTDAAISPLSRTSVFELTYPGPRRGQNCVAKVEHPGGSRKREERPLRSACKTKRKGLSAGPPVSAERSACWFHGAVGVNATLPRGPRMRRRLESKVVVITGASRGIGRATARLFAERGASVVLAARREDALLEVAAECEARGGRGLAVPTDVSDYRAVESLGQRAVDHFGRIDVWVNNAVLAAVGRLEEVPPEANRRVVEANLLGYIHGAQAALPRFREQGSGVLILMSSGFGLVGAPYADAYTATKFAQRGLAQALRGELCGSGVHVCTVMPVGVDIPA